MTQAGAPNDASVPPAAAGQRRYVTVLFSDVSDSSRHAEQLEAEEYAALLEKFRVFARDAIPRHGGSIARLQGDGVLALFGHHESREDDGRRATQAALALHAAVARLRIGRGRDARPLQLHSGIHAGLVLLIEGDIERGRFDVVGEVPNTAARLCSMAGAGEILVSEETLGPHAHIFDVMPSRRTAIRGRTSPLNVLRVLGRAQVERRIDAAARRGVVPLIGRGAALEELLRAARGAANTPRSPGSAPVSAPSLVHISGEPGVGKTRLIDEFQARLDRTAFQVVQGYCESYLGAEPLQPFLNGLRAAIGWHDDHAVDRSAVVAREAPIPPCGLSEAAWSQVEPNARRLLGRGPTGTDEAGEKEAAPALSGSERRAAIVDLLATLGDQRTLVLILDDWQWADDASRETLHSVLGHVQPLLVVLAARSGGLDDDPVAKEAQPLLLQPLDAAAGEHAVAAWLPEADPFLVQEIYRQSGGSPLFIEELCHAAAAGGDLSAQPAVPGVAWIDALVASRLARLPAELAECLHMASVIGNVVPIALLQRVVGQDAALLAQRLLEQDFLMPTAQAGTMRFRHILTRDAVYATVAPEQRRSWHLRVARTLEAAAGDAEAFESLEALSYHYDAADRSEQAVRFAVAAGDKAFAAMALDRARAHYLTALRALDALPALSRAMQLQWCAVAQKLGQTCVFDPLDMAESSLMFERAVRLAEETGDINAIARAEYWMAYVNYSRGRPRDAVRFSEAALEHAQASADTRLAAQLVATLGQSLASAGRYEQALPLLADAVEKKRQQSRPGSGTAIGSAYCLARMGYIHGDQGRFDEARAYLDQALAMLGDAVHSLRASIYELVCAVHLWQGRWLEAREAGFAGAEIALRCRSRYLTAMGRALGNCAVWAIDGDEPALRALRDATHWIDARGGAVSTSLNHGWLVEAAVTMGHAAEARQHAARLLQRARLHDWHGHAMGCRALARLSAGQGRSAAARRYLDAADRGATLRGSLRELAVNQMARAELALALGTRAEAKARLDSAAESFERMQMQWHLQRARSLSVAL